MSSKPYIIIVEDDPNLGKIYQTALNKAGYEADLDTDGLALMPLLKKRTPDLIILDMHVPFAWGPDTVQALKENPQTRDIKRLITTADIFVAKDMRNNGETVLVKPLGVPRLLEAVEKLLKDTP